VTFSRLPTRFPEIVLLEPQVHGDERGFLVETFRREAFREHGVDADFVQENFSRSARDVVRGIHGQRGQAKLIRCSRGRIWDVVVDLRAGSPTLGEWEGHDLTDENHRQLFVPDGFGHGYCVLSDEADVTYRLSDYYDPERELRVAWNDPELGIEWPVAEPALSEQDRAAPPLSEAIARSA
jgi:dTDP-4-dehydrorhamnose 3,5-epimerase